jgi:hypothetical protein
VRSPSPAIFTWSSAEEIVEGAPTPLKSSREAYADAFVGPPSSQEVPYVCVSVCVSVCLCVSLCFCVCSFICVCVYIE